ncbi:Enoyl-CoA hydratase/carnithine racemase [Lutimaribacter pacificus]|uniref:Enoyl-CoA hydratase/carnithine racemase n=1 Tax=Lutimaribacter pacificus TaxID=391948 RepID=A0A1H0I1I2_9RHOB|nr:crotonase/enoyl-CoA hydratase family protein [Lutimaribacter pacificus]SDO25327.1 Enoyl-CoA hydratase/carnithine racemase [Lutimaribacter pacificus]SHK28080.1 Enoyl-CoA hydratase/carnithine racemase [Lutimaribacter pacificus]
MPDSLLTRIEGPIAVLTMNRPDKRNAMNDRLLAALDGFFSNPPEGVKVAVLTGTAGHYCSGLDLSEQVQRDAEGTMRHSRGWHGVMDKIQFSGLPVVSAMFGAVIGGGLELATATHVRIAEPSTIFQLPEGRRGIYVGGGASVRVGRILGADRMIEMMLTGRKYDADQGERLGLCHYTVGEGEAMGLAMELAGKIAQNASLSNYVMIHALSRIEDMSKADGLFTESLCAALTQTSPDAEEGLRAFLEKRQPQFR